MSTAPYERAQIEALQKAYAAEKEARERAERMLRLTEDEVVERDRHIATLQEMVMRAHADGWRR